MPDQLKYSSNEFLSKTVNSNDKKVKLIVYHTSQLKLYAATYPTDTDYPLMYNRTFPLANDAQKKYSIVDNAEGTQVGQTEAVNIGLKSIKGSHGLARDWYNRTAALYAIKNPARMKAIWNKGLKPFAGKMDNVISALNTLSMNIGDDTNPLMIAIKAEVDAEYAVINPDRATQTEDKGTTELRQKELNAACILAMDMEYMNSGLLMNKFSKNVDNIQESFHDMPLLLSKQQNTWDINLAALETKNIATRTQLATSKFRATAIGGNAKMYLASTPGGIDSKAVDLIDGIENKFTALAFGVTDYGINRYITVVNMTAEVERYKLSLG